MTPEAVVDSNPSTEDACPTACPEGFERGPRDPEFWAPEGPIADDVVVVAVVVAAAAIVEIVADFAEFAVDFVVAIVVVVVVVVVAAAASSTRKGMMREKRRRLWIHSRFPSLRFHRRRRRRRWENPRRRKSSAPSSPKSRRLCSIPECSWTTRRLSPTPRPFGTTP